MFAHHVFVAGGGKVSIDPAQIRTAGRHFSASAPSCHVDLASGSGSDH
jgi:hypothetical protein